MTETGCNNEHCENLLCECDPCECTTENTYKCCED